MDFCNHIHKGLVKDVKYVLCWGVSCKHYPQRCGLSHTLQDEDVVQVVKKKVLFSMRGSSAQYSTVLCLSSSDSSSVVAPWRYPGLLHDEGVVQVAKERIRGA